MEDRVLDAELIRRVCAERWMTFKDLREASGVSRAQITRVVRVPEPGQLSYQPKMPTIVRLAAALDCDINDITRPAPESQRAGSR